MLPPPGMYPPPPPPPRRGGGFVRGIFVTLATTIFGFSLLMNVYLLIASGILSAESSRSTTLVQGDPAQKIAVIPIHEVITDSTVTSVRKFLRQADQDHVRAIVLSIDSPGGTVTASDEIYHQIRTYKADHGNVPIIVTMGGTAASGGYYIACAADYLYAQPTTLTGNIGVLMPRFNISKLAERWGIEETTIQSTGADYKNAGSMFRPEKPQENAYFQAMIDQTFQQFKAVVRAGRGSKLNRPLDEIADGKAYLGPVARDLGLVDAVGYSDDAYAYAKQAANLSNPTIIRYQAPASLMRLLTSESKLGSGHGEVTLQIDRDLIDELMAPRLMYLWRGQ
jgi:protease-4